MSISKSDGALEERSADACQHVLNATASKRECHSHRQRSKHFPISLHLVLLSVGAHYTGPAHCSREVCDICAGGTIPISTCGSTWAMPPADDEPSTMICAAH